MSDKLGQQVVVENRAGAGGLVAIRTMKSMPADGYTLLAPVNTLAVQQAINKEAGDDVTRDFVGVGPINSTPFLLVAGTTQPDASLPELLARAKANPGKVTYASAGNGSTTHLGAAYFAQRAGLNLVHVP